MKIYNNQLFCAGKSNPNSMTIWDLRKFESPMIEKEKNLDIFSMFLDENILYYGCRDHKVHRLRLSDFEILKPYETAHYDTVTSLALYDGSLVSGSRDKNLRIWNRDEECEIKTVISAHPEWINCLAADYLQRALYSGGKEGRIRVWNGNSREINYAGEIIGHNASVTCILAVNADQQVMISASVDKTFKVWKLDEENPFQNL